MRAKESDKCEIFCHKHNLCHSLSCKGNDYRIIVWKRRSDKCMYLNSYLALLFNYIFIGLVKPNLQAGGPMLWGDD